MPSLLLAARDFANSHTAIVASRPLLNHIGPRLMQSPMKVKRRGYESVCSLRPELCCRISPLFEFTETNIRTALPILKHCSVSKSFQSSLAIVTNDNVTRDAALYKQFVELLSGEASSSFQHLDSLLLRVSLRRGLDPGKPADHIPLQEVVLPTNLPSLRRLCVVTGGRILIRPSTLKQIASNFRGLTHLELHPSTFQAQVDLGEMLSALVNLRALRLQQVFSIGDSGQNCFLDSLTLRLQHLALRDVGHSCSLVRHTRNSNGIETTPLAQYLARARELTYFELEAPHEVMLGGGRKVFQPELIGGDGGEARVFNIEHLILLADIAENVDFLRSFPKLRSFKARLQSSIDTASFRSMTQLAPSLTALDLGECAVGNVLSEDTIQSLQPLLSLCWSDATEPVSSLHLLSRLQNLTALDITSFGGFFAADALKAELVSFRLPQRLEVFVYVAGTGYEPPHEDPELFSCLKHHPKGLLRHVRLPTYVQQHEAVYQEWCGPQTEIQFTNFRM